MTQQAGSHGESPEQHNTTKATHKELAVPVLAIEGLPEVASRVQSVPDGSRDP